MLVGYGDGIPVLDDVQLLLGFSGGSVRWTSGISASVLAQDRGRKFVEQATLDGSLVPGVALPHLGSCVDSDWILHARRAAVAISFGKSSRLGPFQSPGIVASSRMACDRTCHRVEIDRQDGRSQVLEFDAEGGNAGGN